MVNDGYLLIKLLGPIVFTIICHSTYFMHISLILSLSALVIVDRAGGRRRSHSSNSTSTTLSLSRLLFRTGCSVYVFISILHLRRKIILLDTVFY